jgi:hypothetical protein
MNPDRFDTLTRSLAGRVSRRSMMRGTGAGLVATVLAAAGLRPAVARQAGSSWYTVIRRYTLTGAADPVIQELNDGYLPLISQAQGYVSYTVVSSDNNTLTSITTFESQALLDQAGQDEAEWVQENLASLLPAPAEVTQGDAVIANVNTDLICDAGPAPTATVVPTQAPTETPTEVPTVVPTPCTGIGCPCNGGVQDACDDGLVCCQSQMNGGPMPGGPGMCAAEDACGDGGCTGIGCPCQSGVENACDDGLVCCQSQMNGGPTPGGDGMCAADDACGDGTPTD